MDKRYLVVAVSGKAGTGKDTFASLLRDELGKLGVATKHISFAKPLKDMAQKYFPFCDVVTKDPVSRQTLQGLGTLVREEFDQNYWVQLALDTIKITPEFTVYTITDLRYKNEAEHLIYILNENVVLCRMVGRDTSLEGDAAQHQSETDLDDFEEFDTYIHNGGSLEELRVQEVLPFIEGMRRSGLNVPK